MSNSVNVYLPLNTYVNVYGFTNAAFMQQVTITDENGNSYVMDGQGEHNSPMQNGNFSIQTPSTSVNPQEGYMLTVTVLTQENGMWISPNVTSGKTSLMYYNIVMVVSEDYSDEDWNDAVVQFCWWTSPAARSYQRF